MTKEGPCHGMTIKPWQAEVWFRLGPERINVPIQFFFFFSLSLVLSVFLLQPPPHKLVRRESGRGCCGSGEAGWVPPAWLIPWCKGFSSRWLLLLRSRGARVHGLSCPAACGIFLDQGWNLCPLHKQVGS